MSTTNSIDQIEYPESDGKPMGETDTHMNWMFRIRDILSFRYRGQHVYVSSNLLVYYREGDPTRFIVPDNFVVLGCEPRERRVFKIWEEGRSPDVVFEVTSKSTRKEDLVTKPKLYEQMGVREYFLYDPTAEYLKPPLQGHRWHDDAFVHIEPSNGELACETLGFNLSLDGLALQFIDATTRQSLLTEAETLCEEVDALQEKADALRREAASTKREVDEQTAARLAAEARIRELEAELDRRRNEDT